MTLYSAVTWFAILVLGLGSIGIFVVFAVSLVRKKGS